MEHAAHIMPKNLIKRQNNIFKRPNNTFSSTVFIYLGAQLILPHYLLDEFFRTIIHRSTTSGIDYRQKDLCRWKLFPKSSHNNTASVGNF